MAKNKCRFMSVLGIEPRTFRGSISQHVKRTHYHYAIRTLAKVDFLLIFILLYSGDGAVAEYSKYILPLHMPWHYNRLTAHLVAPLGEGTVGEHLWQSRSVRQKGINKSNLAQVPA